MGNKRGSYGYVDPYGIYRQVEYVADDKGFRAVIKTNEPGTENQSPADIEILSEAAPVKFDPSMYAQAPEAATYTRPIPVIDPRYAQPAGSVSAPATLSQSAPLAPAASIAPVSPLTQEAPLASGRSLAPATPIATLRALAPVAAHAPTYEKTVAAPAYAPAQVHTPAPSTYAPVPANYGRVTPAYAPAPIYEAIAPQSYASPSFEQHPERPRQSTESRSSSE